KHNVFISHVFGLVKRDKQSIGDIEVTEAVSDLHVFLHGTTQNTNTSIELLCYIQNDLQAMNRRSECTNDNPPLCFGKYFLERWDNRALRWRSTGHCGFGGV